jgi:hypothetical protein
MVKLTRKSNITGTGDEMKKIGTSHQNKLHKLVKYLGNSLHGYVSNITGIVSGLLYGNVKNTSGDASNTSGYVNARDNGLHTDISIITGYVSGIKGDVSQGTNKL